MIYIVLLKIVVPTVQTFFFLVLLMQTHTNSKQTLRQYVYMLFV